jgi:ABC-type polysaccharide transport system, permease component
MLGIYIAFQKFIPARGFSGSKFVGLDNFKYIFSLPDIYQVLWNTIFIAFLKLVTMLVVPVLFALLLNELSNKHIKRGIQTLVYFPHFLSWVILAGILIDILSPSSGIVNQVIKALGAEPVFFLGDEKIFPYTMVLTNVWKEFGFGAVVYLASLTGIDPVLYEASFVDGAGRWKQMLHITLPGITPMIVLMMILSLGDVLNAGFDQIFNLYSPQVYSTGDIIDTLVYRLGLRDAQFGPATAVGLLKSIVSFVFISVSYVMADKVAKYRVF